MTKKRHPTPSRTLARRRYWLASIMGVAALVAAGYLLPIAWSAGTPQPVAAPSESVTAPTSSAPLPSSAPSLSPSQADADALTALPGSVPAHGSGTFTYASGGSAVFGKSGTLRRYRVAVEKGSDEDATEFAALVDATLGNELSWAGAGNIRLQRVSGNEAASFTVYLATRDTAGRMCLTGGVDVRVGGKPYTSCRTTGRAIINLDRWRLSSDPYLEAKVPLATYRQYVINHEVGHELGHSHEGCPEQGGPAPVMVQQTLTLRGCVPYAWPRRDGKLFSGPGL